MNKFIILVVARHVNEKAAIFPKKYDGPHNFKIQCGKTR